MRTQEKLKVLFENAHKCIKRTYHSYRAFSFCCFLLALIQHKLNSREKTEITIRDVAVPITESVPFFFFLFPLHLHLRTHDRERK